MACNCNDNKTNCYNISMGCVVPALANPNAYFTKSEINEMLEEIVISGGVTSGEVQSMIDASIPTNVSAFVNDVPYLTEHQSLEGYATEQWVQNQHYITGVDLSDYATKEYVSGYTYDKETIDEKVASGGSFDPTQYYNKTATDALLDEKLNVTAYTPTDLSNYYTKSETSGASQIATALNAKTDTATTSALNDVVTAHTANTTVHVTAGDKIYWDGKQDALTAGSGISIQDNVISAEGGGGEIDTYVSGVTRNDSRSIKVDKNGNIRNTIYFSTINGNGIVESSSVVTDIKVPTLSQFSAHTASTTVHVTASEKSTWNNKVDSSTLNNYLLKSKIWCGTQAAYNSLGTYDPETLYLIHE